MMNFDVKHLKAMAHSPIRNYVVPGVTSSLIGGSGPGNVGHVRLFECSREQVEHVTPHSHRYDFTAHVLAGKVRNVLWTTDWDGDKYARSDIRYMGRPGEFEKVASQEDPLKYSTTSITYEAGQSYSMKSYQIHSIFFGRGAIVLVFESAPVSDSSVVLDPVVDNAVIDTSCKVEPWMYQRASK